MAALTITYKKFETTRITAQLALAGVPVDLTNKVVKVKLALSDQGETVVTLTDGAGVGVSSGSGGQFFWEVSAANIAALGNPTTIWTVINIFNNNNTLAYTGKGFVSVTL